MTVNLPDDLVSSIREEVRRGRFASEGELIAAAVREYLRRQAQEAPMPTPRAGAGDELSDQELQRRLVEAGVLGEVRPPITDLTPYCNRQAGSVAGEPVSETILRERR